MTSMNRLSVAAFLLAAFLLSCDSGEEETTGPIGPPNPNDPYPFWVINDPDYYKYDQFGNKLAFLQLVGPGGHGYEYLCQNPSNGDMWFSHTIFNGPYYIKIYDRNAQVKKVVRVDDLGAHYAVDTCRRWVWSRSYADQNYDYYLYRRDYNANLLATIKIPRSDYWTDLDYAVYEKTGDIWVLGHTQGGDSELVKMTKDGDLLLSRKFSAMGLPTPYAESSLKADQTDGSLWVDCNNYFQKLNPNGSKALRINVDGDIFDVGRSSGSVLAYNITNRNLESYSSSGVKLWAISGFKKIHDGGIVDATGDVLVLHPDAGIWLCVSKFDARGTPIFASIGIARYDHYPLLEIKNDPYPY